jgi:hypothetical protein
MIEPDLSPDPRACRRTAFHEAGHAVVGWALGVEVVRVWLEDASTGRVGTGPVDHLRAVDQIAIIMAGRAGAALSGIEELHDSELQGDNAQSLQLTKRLFPDDADFGEILHRAGCDRAEAIVSQYADQVALLALELELKGELVADDIQRLLVKGS